MLVLVLLRQCRELRERFSFGVASVSTRLEFRTHREPEIMGKNILTTCLSRALFHFHTSSYENWLLSSYSLLIHKINARKSGAEIS